MSPILIVGAGPVGLTMAAELARYGLSIRIIDRSSRPTETSKALVVWSRTLELMDRMGCTKAFLEGGLRAHGASLRAGPTVLGRPRFDDVASSYNFALMIPQRDTERLMIEHLRSFGIAVERQVDLVSFAEAGDHVEARLWYPTAGGRQS
jgi:2-polyprenyl-6-methoxyphenol hydroxylase-like FAD-dependent oxidoreductase